MTRKIEVPEGYTTWLFASDEETGELVASTRGADGKLREVRRLADVLIPLPKPGHVEEACEGLRHVMTDVDGEKLVYLGPEAAAIQRFTHAAETIRGMLRSQEKDGGWSYTDERIREFAASFTKIAGQSKGGTSRKAVEKAKRDAEQSALNEAHALLESAETPEEIAAVRKQLMARIAALSAT